MSTFDFNTFFGSFLYNEKMAAKCLKVASTAMSCDRDPDVNRTRMVDTVETIIQEHPDVELLLFGEMILG
jgi:hypothetical protein